MPGPCGWGGAGQRRAIAQGPLGLGQSYAPVLMEGRPQELLRSQSQPSSALSPRSSCRGNPPIPAATGTWGRLLEGSPAAAGAPRCPWTRGARSLPLCSASCDKQQSPAHAVPRPCSAVGGDHVSAGLGVWACARVYTLHVCMRVHVHGCREDTALLLKLPGDLPSSQCLWPSTRCAGRAGRAGGSCCTQTHLSPSEQSGNYRRGRSPSDHPPEALAAQPLPCARRGERARGVRRDSIISPLVQVRKQETTSLTEET